MVCYYLLCLLSDLGRNNFIINRDHETLSHHYQRLSQPLSTNEPHKCEIAFGIGTETLWMTDLGGPEGSSWLD